MKLEFNNIGKIKDANIKLDGITIIAGENNTGKSTVGKILYCVFNSFYMIEEQVKNQKISSIRRLLFNFQHEIYDTYPYRTLSTKPAFNIIDNKDYYINNKENLVKDLQLWYEYKENNIDSDLYMDLINQLADRIISYLNITNEKIMEMILKNRLAAEFSMKIGHLNYEEKNSNVDLSIKNSKINIDISSLGEVKINSSISLMKNIIYIDDPFVIDNLNEMVSYNKEPYNHRYNLLNQLSNKHNKGDFGALDQIIVNEKLENIYKVMNDVCDGELTFTEKGNYEYKTKKLKDSLDIVNLSTGLKTFIILKTLLQNGSIEENGIVILDEPEIHLHPEWQLKFAEIIVLLQKEFGLNILLNTHSPYFLNAIEVYSKKYDISDLCNYYITEEKNMETTIKDVTDNIDVIYAKLARPLQDLENMEYEYGNKM